LNLQRPTITTVLRTFLLLPLFLLVACDSEGPADPTATAATGSEGPASPVAATATAGETGSISTAVPETPIAASDAPAPTPTATTEPTATPEPVIVDHLDGSETTMEPLPPASYLELLQSQVEAGEWSEVEGTIQLLKLLVGELEPEQLPVSVEVVSESATGLIRHAQELLQDSDIDPADSAEIERLLNGIAPSQEALDLYSVPEGDIREGDAESDVESAKWQVMSRRQAQDAECADLVADGFRSDDVQGYPCFVYRETELNGFQYRVYYPRYWQDDGDEEKLALVDTAMTALTDSAQTYSPLATIEDVNVIFSLRAPENEDWLAVQSTFDLDEACPITLFPASNARGSDPFKQTIAHEVFHCVQDWNFTTSPYSQHKWWIEGSAEYFSNVVYPTTNDEHRFLRSFELSSRSSSLMEMSYHNFIFFQYLANQIGDAELIALLKNMSAAGGTSSQAQVLANYGDMAGMFLDFTVSFMSEGVPDTGGGVIVLEHPAVSRLEPVDEENVEKFEVRPFVPARFGVSYVQERRFLQEALPGADGRHSMVDNTMRRDKSAWSDVPPEVRSSCDDDSIYALAVTSVDGNYTLEIDVGTMEEAECDPCLLGAWEVDHQSFNEYIARIAADTPAAGVSFSMEVTGGRQLVQFMEDGDMLTAREAFQLTLSGPEAPPMVSTTDAEGGGEYSADGEILTFRNVVETTTHSTMVVDGIPISVESNPQVTNVSIFGHTTTIEGSDLPETNSGGQGEYVCTDDTLTITMQQYGDIKFNRVDELLPTPVPTPGP
jgi:hypothetical protein